MELSEAIDIVVARTGHGRYRDLCDPAHPSYNPDYIPVVMAKAAAAVAGNAMAAVGRVVGAAVRGEPIRVPAEVHAARLATCLACEFNGARPSGVRCGKCGCGGLKLRLATEKCPVAKW